MDQGSGGEARVDISGINVLLANTSAQSDIVVDSEVLKDSRVQVAASRLLRSIFLYERGHIRRRPTPEQLRLASDIARLRRMARSTLMGTSE